MNISVIFYSMTGNTAALARAVAGGAERAGADVRLLRVHELIPPDVIAQSPKMQETHEQLAAIPLATNDDLLSANGVAFGSPTRYGNMSSQLKNFIDQTGKLWVSGALVGKIAAVFCSTSTMHGGQESTLLSMVHPALPPRVHRARAPVRRGGADEHGRHPRRLAVRRLLGERAGRRATADRGIDLTLARALGRRLTIAAGKLAGA